MMVAMMDTVVAAFADDEWERVCECWGVSRVGVSE